MATASVGSHTRVGIHICGASLWAGVQQAQWQGAPAVRIAGDGTLLFGSDASGDPTEESILRLLDGDRFALGATAPMTEDALSVVFAGVFGELGSALPVADVLACFPTHWGGRRRALLENALRRVADETTLIPVALSPGAARIGRRGAVSGRARCLVVEFEESAITVSYTIYDTMGDRIETCEHLPGLSLDRLRTDDRAGGEFLGLLTAAAGERRVDTILVVGIGFADLEVIGALLRTRYADTVDVRLLTGSDLVYAPTGPSTSEWAPAKSTVGFAPKAAVAGPGKHWAAAGIVAAALIGVVVAVAALVIGHRSANETHRAAQSSPPVPSTANVPTTQPITVGRLDITAPIGWRERTRVTGDPPDRTYLVPVDGRRQRITVDQLTVGDGWNLGQLAARLQRQIENRSEEVTSGSSYSAVQQQKYGDRATVFYQETRKDNEQVKWHVMVEHGVQVTVGCQYRPGEGDAIAGACEQTVAAIRVGP